MRQRSTPSPLLTKLIARAAAEAAAAAVGVLAEDAGWNEGDHPRDDDGKFTSGGGGSVPAAAPAPAPAAAAKPAKVRKPLTPEQKEIESRFAAQLNADYRGAVDAYSKLPDAEGGKVLNTDTARELSADYLADRTQSAAVHEPASDFIKRRYAEMLTEQPGPGEVPMVLFTGGGTGAGKSTAIKTLPQVQELKDHAQVVMDTNMNTYDSAKKKVEQALAAGKEVRIAMVVRDPEEALVNGALTRAMRQEKKYGSGRTVPIEEHIRTHEGARDVVLQLAEEYADDENVKIIVIDNTRGLGGAQEADLAWLRAQKYNQVEQRVRAALEREREAGRISERVYRGFAGTEDEAPAAQPPAGGEGEDRGVRQGAGQGPGGQPQPQRQQGLTQDAAVKAAGILLLTPQGTALFIRRSSGGDHAGEWCLPGGGIEDGETAEDAACRESLEEIGALPYGERDVVSDDVSGEGVRYTTFRQPIAHEFTPRLSDESTEHQWAPLDAPPEPLHPGVRQTISGLAMDDGERWITVNGGEGKGTPVKITAGGVVVGGAGGSLNGKVLSTSGGKPAKPDDKGGASKLKDVAKALQNRNRNSAASVSQMNKIASNPNPRLLMASPTMADGAPVVSDLAGKGIAKLTGKRDWVVTSKREIPIRYAVVEADQLSASNRADGSRNEEYGSNPDKLVAINNGRTAGLIEAYSRGTADAYKAMLAKSERIHGIPGKDIKAMKSPVLVRVMDAADVDEHIGDESNAGMTLNLSAVEQAQNDATRFDPASIEFSDDGTPTDASVRGFINAMPQAEQQSLSPNGRPTRQAIDRMMAATFHAAYGDSELVTLMAQATDQESRNLIGGLSRASGSMAKLKDAGELDIREIVTGAAKQIINAVRSGVSIKKFLKQGDLLTDSAQDTMAALFAENIRSAKAIGERLDGAAKFALSEAQRAGIDMFGEQIPTASRAQVLESMHA